MHIYGWYDRGNCGDDAFKTAFDVLFPGIPKSYSEPGKTDWKSVGARPRVLGGGDVVKPFYIDRIPHDASITVLGCGLGYESEAELLKHPAIKAAYLRNRSDVDIASRYGVQAGYVPDLCFSLFNEAEAKIAKQRGKGEKKRLGVILSAHPSPSIGQPKIQEAAYFEYLQWELAKVLDALAPYYSINWISLSSDVDAWDEGVGYSVRRRMTKRENHRFFDYTSNTPEVQLDVVGSMDLVITAKFHGAIFSIISGVPFLALGQTRKLQQLCLEEDLDDLCIPPFSFEFHRALSYVKTAEEPLLREKLLSIARQKQVELFDVARNLTIANSPAVQFP